MAEALVSAILQQITTILGQEALEKARQLGDVKEEMKKLESNLAAIEALLADAEQRKITDRSVELWLDRLKEESLDIEDALDKWKIVLLDQPTKNASFLQRKVCFFPRYFSFTRRVAKYHRIARSIKEINGRLDDIAKGKDRYQLKSETTRTVLREESQSLIDESNVVGRHEIKKKIIDLLLCGTSNEEEGSPIQTISIVGMVGIGKTNLAQLVYNDEAVKQNFTRRIWACVSDNLDVRKVAIAILEALEEGLENLPNLPVQSLPTDAFLKRVRKSIEGKKYLLILDDLWTKDENLGGLSFTFKHGAPGSRILVTTRKDTVAQVMRSSHTIHLENLSQDVIWSILRRKALRGKDQETREDLEAIGLKIAKKCKGIPLVAETLGDLLQFKTTKQGWEEVLNSELWEMKEVYEDVFKPLLLSYYDLPLPVRQCFTYCAVFAKDHHFLVPQLIQHWRAQNYLVSDHGNESSMKFKGFQYFKCLEARSFFQDFDCGYNARCKMHDLVHDFALFLTKGEFVTVKVSNDDKHLKMKSEKTCRHLTVMVEKDLPFPESIPGIEKVRSLVGYGDNVVISEKALCNLFNQARLLRLLELNMRGYQGSTVPKEIGNLLHLRYLNLTHSGKLKSLPKALCRLQNLQFLDLYSCTDLERLPDEIANLVNLKLLRTVGCTGLTFFPKGVTRLTQLTQLLGLIVRVDRDDSEEFSIGDLANLKQLVVLFMKTVGKPINVAESKKVQLQNLQEVKIWVAEAITGPDIAILESLNMSSVPRHNFETSYYFKEEYSTSRDEFHYYGF